MTNQPKEVKREEVEYVLDTVNIRIAEKNDHANVDELKRVFKEKYGHEYGSKPDEI